MSNKKLKLTDARSSYKPFTYPWCYEAFLQSEQMHWVTGETPMIEDVNDWKNKLTENEKKFLTHIFRFFTQGDIDIAGAYVNNYLPMFPAPEVRMMLSSFASRECFDKETEVLTDKGWKKFSDLDKTELVAQFDPETKEISFAKPTDYVKKHFTGNLHYYKNTRTDICVTPKHRLALINPHSGILKFKESEAGIWGGNFLYPVNGVVNGEESISTLTRLLIAIQADAAIRLKCGGYENDPSRQNDLTVDFALKKDRKKQRLISFIKELGLNLNEREQGDGFSKFTFSLAGLCDRETLRGVKEFDFIDVTSLTTKQADEIIEELVLWDGCVDSVWTYYNVNEKAIDKIQAVAAVSSYGCTKGINRHAGKIFINGNERNSRTCYRLTFSKGETRRCYPHRVEVPYDDLVYCVTMPKGTVVTRRKGKVSIQANCVHISAYSHLIETLGIPETTYNEFLEYEEMRAKHDYIESFIGQDERSLAQQIAVFSAFTEGMQLFSSFIMLLNFTRFGKMKGMGQIIAWSIADETLHTESMIRLFREFIKENKHIWTDDLKAQIYSIAEKMVDLEDKFIDLAFGINEMEGLTKEEVKQYIRYIADRRLIALGLKGIFKVKKNPLPWVDGMLGTTHSNFFEQRVTDYAKGALTGSWEDVWAKAA